MIAILSDFGQTEYLGIMKGVILRVADQARIVDLCNSIHPQRIKEGAWVLKQAYSFFPKNTIFLCVVDPGVGGERKGMVARTQQYYFVGPDNGVMMPAMEEDGIINSVSLVPGEHASATFHGRDVFSVAAAKLEKGVEISALGKEHTPEGKLAFSLKGRKGEIVRVDHFGNVITNIPPENKTQYAVKSGTFSESLSLFGNYDAAPDKGLFLVVGSSNTLEISKKNGSAAEESGLRAESGIEIS